MNNMTVITNEIGTRMTDHKVITLNSYIHIPEWGPGYWKLNITLLEDDEYCKEIEQIISNTVTEPTLQAVSIGMK